MENMKETFNGDGDCVFLDNLREPNKEELEKVREIRHQLHEIIKNRDEEQLKHLTIDDSSYQIQLV